MARFGGNPDLKKYQFTTNRDEPLTERFSIRITSSMYQELRMLDNWREFVREAISDKLKKSNRTHTLN